MGGFTVSRRQLLAAGLVGGAGALISPKAEATLRLARSVLPAGSDLGAIEHVIFLIQENRSFDHYFGSYRGVRGFDDHGERDLDAFAQPWPANTTKPPVGELLPFHLDTQTTNAECTYDLAHDWASQHECWNGGRMDGFVTTHTSPAEEGPANGVLTMGYYTAKTSPFITPWPTPSRFATGTTARSSVPRTRTVSTRSRRPWIPQGRPGGRS